MQQKTKHIRKTDGCIRTTKTTENRDGQAEPDFALMGEERIPDKKDRGHDGVNNIAQEKRRNTKKTGSLSQAQTRRGEQCRPRAKERTVCLTGQSVEKRFIGKFGYVAQSEKKIIN